MQALGRALGRAARAGDRFLLEGPFGAGKTTFVQGLADGLERHRAGQQSVVCDREPVPGPTGRCITWTCIDSNGSSRSSGRIWKSICMATESRPWSGPSGCRPGSREGGTLLRFELAEPAGESCWQRPSSGSTPPRLKREHGQTLLLALDTSTSTASVALFDGQRVVSETTWLAGREHSTRLLVEVDVALERIGRRSDELTGLVVAHGPGSFTGVRVAVSVAKGMAGRAGDPVVGREHARRVAARAGPIDLPGPRRRRGGPRALSRRRSIATGGASSPRRLPPWSSLRRWSLRRTLVIGELAPDARAQLAQQSTSCLPAAQPRPGGLGFWPS